MKRSLRDAVIQAHELGRGQREIARFLGIPLTTVNLDIKRYEETGSNEDRPARQRARAQGIRGSRLHPRQLPRFHQSRPSLAESHRRMVTKFSGLEPVGAFQASIWSILEEKACAKPPP
ncbi:unnamed protein product, partial [Didymodactylos carnosus]